MPTSASTATTIRRGICRTISTEWVALATMFAPAIDDKIISAQSTTALTSPSPMKPPMMAATSQITPETSIPNKRSSASATAAPPIKPASLMTKLLAAIATIAPMTPMTSATIRMVDSGCPTRRRRPSSSPTRNPIPPKNNQYKRRPTSNSAAPIINSGNAMFPPVN